MDKKKQARLAIIIVATLLVIDQIVKIWVKTHMQLGEDIPLIGTWCRLHFTENVGFAFGMNFGGNIGKVVLTLFRLVASVAIVWFIAHFIRKGCRTAQVAYISLILTGAVGNLIDSCFYGLIFNEPYYSVATLFPPEGGYAPLFLGRVVDMFYFPLFEFVWPEWVPFWGGQHFEFFSAIFNIADAAITIGMFWMIIDIFFVAPKHSKSTETKEAASKE